MPLRSIMPPGFQAHGHGVVSLAIRRNIECFPDDFMFQLTSQEAELLRFHSETSKKLDMPIWHIKKGVESFFDCMFKRCGGANERVIDADIVLETNHINSWLAKDITNPRGALSKTFLI